MSGERVERKVGREKRGKGVKKKWEKTGSVRKPKVK